MVCFQWKIHPESTSPFSRNLKWAIHWNLYVPFTCGWHCAPHGNLHWSRRSQIPKEGPRG
jgi:hypothetical protein